MEFEAVIGLEIHAQLLTRSKIFCSCSTHFGAPPNTNTCPVCLGLPGSLPVLNREALAMAVRAALALGCRVRSRSLFARKNYFYPDLPKGYQISQYEQPLAEQGEVAVLTGRRQETGHVDDYRLKRFGITRVHLEEDAGKSVHVPGGDTYVNLNRTGVPLIEIVSEPDLRSSQEAYDFLGCIRRTLLFLGVCDGNMEEGSLRCDANISVRPAGESRLGTKTEIKNLNSFRFLQKALDYEIERQIETLRAGGGVDQETRLWDEDRGRTFTMRTKEEAHDYRYFPDPDLLPVVVSEEWAEEIRASLPELPEERRARLVEQYGVSSEDALQLIQSPAFADYFEEAARSAGDARPVLNWMTGELTRHLKEEGRDISDCPVTAVGLADLIRLVEQGAISGKIAKEVFRRMYLEGKSAEEVVAEQGLRQISDEGRLEEVVDRILQANPREVEAYRGGKEGLLGFFVGQVMRETRGQANPQVVNRILRQRLGADA